MCQPQAITHLGVSGVGVEDVGEELARNGDTCDDQSVYVVRVDDERQRAAVRRCAMTVIATDALHLLCHGLRQDTHAIEIHQKAEEDLIRGWTVFEYPQEVAFYRDGRHVSGMEVQGRCWRRHRALRCRRQRRIERPRRCHRVGGWRIVRAIRVGSGGLGFRLMVDFVVQGRYALQELGEKAEEVGLRE